MAISMCSTYADEIHPRFNGVIETNEVVPGVEVTVEVNPLFSDNVAMSLEGSWGLVHPLILPHHGVVASNTINYRSLRRVGGQRCFRPQ